MESRDALLNKHAIRSADDQSRDQTPLDPRQRVLALALELCKRAAESKSLEDLYFLFVNDLHVLLEFDRCFLITHLGGRSRFVAANNLPTLESKSKLYGQVNALAPRLVTLDKGVYLSGKLEGLDHALEGMDPELSDALKSYVGLSDRRYCFFVPFMYDDAPIAHLVFEFMDEDPPDQMPLVAFLRVAPLLTSVLVEKWLLDKKPDMAYLLGPAAGAKSRALKFSRRYLIPLAIVLVLLGTLLFYVPLVYTVGGEAVVSPWDRHVAFCKMDGLIDKVLVEEGAHVKKGEILAILDPTDLDYRMESARRESDILVKKMDLLSFESDKDPSKLGERKIVGLERKKVLKDLKHLQWQSQFLNITAPVDGIILTRDVESLAGKKMKEGEPFCEIAVPGQLAADVFVPEDKVGYVRKGQTEYIYLNNNPMKGHRLKVEEIAPAAEVTPRLGNVCRVRARFTNAPKSVKVGMKGVGKIDTVKTNLWFVTIV